VGTPSYDININKHQHQQTNIDVKIRYSEIEIHTFYDLYQKKKAGKFNNIYFY